MNIRKRIWVWKGRRQVAWRVDWRERGDRRQKQFKTRQEAELYRNKLIRERYAQDYGALLEDITLREFMSIYEKKKPWRTESYQERVLSSLKGVPFLEVKLSRLSLALVESYRDARLKSCSPATVRQDLAALSDCLMWAVKLRYLHMNPCKEVERPSLPVKQDDPAAYLTHEDFEKLCGVAGRDKPLYEFAVWTGLRITELLDLEWPDTRDGYVVVKRGKGRKQRIVPLLPNALRALQDVPRAVFSQRVFWWSSDRHATLRRFQRRCRWAGIQIYKFHHLRHTFGSWAAMSGVNLEVIAQAMGHSSTTVTKLYAHLSPEYKRNELMKMAKMGTKAVHESHKALQRKE